MSSLHSVLSTSEESMETRTQKPTCLYRLFVGWVPKHYTAHELRPLFAQCGDVRDIAILKDKVSGQPRGCAFVSFASREDAEVAINQLDRRVQLPGSQSPLEVRFARSHHYVNGPDGAGANRQIFFSRAPILAAEEHIRQVFGAFGTVEEINLFRERRTNLSKGCGFVLMGTREQAVGAIEGLDETYVMEGSTAPLSVRWADPELQVKKKRSTDDGNSENRMLFFAKILRSATEDDLKQLFNKFGNVYAVNLFRGFQGAPTSKGCGLVTFGTHEEAAVALEALDSKYVWDGMDSPMVVKWMDIALQKRRREEHLATRRQGLLPAAMGSSSFGMASMMKVELPELPPAGCAPDALKLFVGNIPRSYSEEQLKPFFESVGAVVDLVIVRDKVTQESKGSAFVWFATRDQALQAISQFNLRHILSDHNGNSERPLVVRQANPRHKMQLSSYAGQLSEQPYPAAYTETPVPVHIQNVMKRQAVRDVMVNRAQSYSNTSVDSLVAGMDNLHLVDGSGVAVMAPIVQHGGAVSHYVGGPFGGPQQGPAMGQQRVLYADVTQMAPPHAHAQVYAPVHLPAQLGQAMHAVPVMTLSIPLTGSQAVFVSSVLPNLQSMCGAQLALAPGPQGMYYLSVSGSEQQLDAAKPVLASILKQAA